MTADALATTTPSFFDHMTGTVEETMPHDVPNGSEPSGVDVPAPKAKAKAKGKAKARAAAETELESLPNARPSAESSGSDKASGLNHGTQRFCDQ